jgi:hypothetical protein
MWNGYHKCDEAEAYLGNRFNEIEEQERAIKKIQQERDREIRKIMESRPVFFPEKHEIWDKAYDNCYKDNPELSKKLEGEINVNLRELSVNLINHWNEPIAKNTIEDLSKACQWAIENETGDGKRLKSWDNRLKDLKDKIFVKEFWGKYFWFMELKLHGEELSSMMNIKLNAIVVSVLKDYDNDKGKEMIDNFQGKLIALRVNNRKEEKKKFWEHLITGMIDKDIGSYDFWADLYCLFRLKLRP